MIAAWMLVSTVLGVVVALGALALDGASRAAHRSVRWTWAGAICAVVLLTVLLPFRRSGEAVPLRIGTVATVTTRNAPPTANAPLVLRVLASARSVLDAPVAQLVRVVARTSSPTADRWLLGGWIACSLGLLALGTYVLRRLLAARRSWPTESLHGERVHVASSAGPAVIGFVHGAIVVPGWLAECTAEVQQVVLAHEREHLRARDPLLLALGAAAVILLPWNVAVWWMLARLRLAVEIDCDRRVIDAGVRARDYGTLLIDLAGRPTGIPVGAPLVGLTMLAEHTTHLERRIVAMSAPRPRHTVVRIAAGSLVALTAVLAACEARMPTSVDVDNMTAASAERVARVTGILGANDSLRTYYVDGRLVTAAEARDVAPDRIASITVLHDSTDPSKGTVRIATLNSTEAARSPAGAGGKSDAHPVTIQFVRKLPTGAVPNPRIVPDTLVEFGVQGSAAHAASPFHGLVFIDGKRVDDAMMKQLNPSDIQSVQVIKGPRAAALYPTDPNAAQGVIQIITKHGAH